MKACRTSKVRADIVDVCKRGEFYVIKQYLHVQNKVVFLDTRQDMVLDRSNHGVPLNQSTTTTTMSSSFAMFGVFRDGQVVMNLTSLKSLMNFLKFPRTHWLESYGWGMVECLYQLVIDKGCKHGQVYNFLTLHGFK